MNTKQKHALILSLTLLALAVLIAGCAQLPPEPGSPGVVGQAKAAVPGYAEPKNFETNPSEKLVFEAGTSAADVKLILSQYAYIYKKGYYLKNGDWAPYEFPDETKEGSNWIPSQATKTLSVEKSDVKEGTDTAAFLAYACTRAGAGWDCNNNKWMAYTLDVIKKECGTPNQYSCDGQTLKLCDENYKFITKETCASGTTCDAAQGKCVTELPPEPGTPGPGQNQTNQTTNTTLGVNLALNKPVTANNGTNPENAVDDRLGAWNTGAGPGAWLYVDLGSNYNINTIIAKWHWDDNLNIDGSRRTWSDVLYQVSTDASNWKTVNTGNTNIQLASNNQIIRYDFPTENARYVRFYYNVVDHADSQQWGRNWGDLDNFQVYART